MFVGETGVGAVIQARVRADEDRPQRGREGARRIGLDVIQKYVNFWYSSSLDLFGGEISSNAAGLLRLGAQGARARDKHRDHIALTGIYHVPVIEDGRIVKREVAMRNAMNEILRDAYIDDNQRGVDRWNKIIAEQGIDFRSRCPAAASIGRWGSTRATLRPAGTRSPPRSASAQARMAPERADRSYVEAADAAGARAGKMAHWIAAPERASRPADRLRVTSGGSDPLVLGFSGHRHEPHGTSFSSWKRRGARDAHELLHVDADRSDEAPADLELIEQRPRISGGAAGDDDRVDGRLLRASPVAIPSRTRTLAYPSREGRRPHAWRARARSRSSTPPHRAREIAA
jgi:hypothetical protein